MSRFFIILILFLNLCKILIYLFYYKKSKNKPDNQKLFNYVILYFTFTSIIFSGIVVNLFRLISDSKILDNYNVSPDEILKVEFLEFISSTIFIICVFYFTNNPKLQIKKNTIVNYQKDLFILSLFNVFSLINLFISNNNNSFLFTELFEFLAGPSSILLIFYCIRYNKRVYLFIAIPLIALVLFKVFTGGNRGPIIGIFFIILFLYIINNTSIKSILKKIPIFLIPIFSIIFLNKEYSKIKFAFASAYVSNPKEYQTIGDLATFVIDYYRSDRSSEIEGSDSNFLEEYEFRFGAKSMYSVGFLRFVNRYNYTLFTPIINTLYIFIPRAYFNENKPYPDSYNGEISGMGMYVCVNEIAGENFMSEYYSSTHYFWQFGYFGVLFLPILSSLYILTIFLFSINLNHINKLLFILIALRPYSFNPQFTISDIIVMLITKVLPFLIFYFIFNRLFSVKIFLFKNIFNK